MKNQKISYLSAIQMANMIKKKIVSPVEIIEVLIERIQNINPKISAYCTLVADDAIKEAKIAEQAILKKHEIGPLHGVPFSVKDLISTKGIRTTFGSNVYEDFILNTDAIAIKRLKSAGAILLGKTNTSEFGYKAVTDKPLFGATKNIWDLKKTAGGSSGGAAAAVACGLGPIAIGNDAGGSVRIPASFCGVLGFKPSRGIIPLHPILSGWESLYRRLVHVGPMTRSVADAALVMDVISGPHNCDPLTLKLKKFSYLNVEQKSVAGLKMGWCSNLGFAKVDRTVLDTTKNAAKAFSKLDCHLEEVKIDFEPTHEAFQLLFAADCAGAVGDNIKIWKDKLDKRFARLVEIGLNVSAKEYVKAINQLHLLWNQFEKSFENYDLIITPTVPVKPFIISTEWPKEVQGHKVHSLNYISLTYPFNITGWPAISIPCGWTKEQLPIGLQIAGKKFGDATVLKAAAAFERLVPWNSKKPDI
jgi:Asp-tRNA(Asn)/Glu-tRNA(Gln) amidotransferase A subunit family amidase